MAAEARPHQSQLVTVPLNWGRRGTSSQRPSPPVASGSFISADARTLSSGLIGSDGFAATGSPEDIRRPQTIGAISLLEIGQQKQGLDQKSCSRGNLEGTLDRVPGHFAQIGGQIPGQRIDRRQGLAAKTLRVGPRGV